MTDSEYAKYLTEIKEADTFRNKAHEGKIAHPFELSKYFVPDSDIFVSIYTIHEPGGAFGSGNEEEVVFPGGETKVLRPLPSKIPSWKTTIFMGTDPHNPDDLGGEVEFWLGEGEKAEKFTITKTTVIVTPPSLANGPVVFRKVDRPYHMMILGTAMTVTEKDIKEIVSVEPPPGFVL